MHCLATVDFYGCSVSQYSCIYLVTLLSVRDYILCVLVFCVVSQSLNTNWQRGLYTLNRIETGSPVLCLQFDSVKIISGHFDSTIKVGSCWCVGLALQCKTVSHLFSVSVRV